MDKRWIETSIVAGYNAVARQIRQSRCRKASRKVRTPQGRVAANSRPASRCHGEPRNRATETSLQQGLRFRAWHRHGLAVMRWLSGLRCCRVKRGNLYPEQHQIGVRAASAAQGGPPGYAGRWHEPASNGASRGMIARRVSRCTKSGLSICLALSLPFMFAAGCVVRPEGILQPVSWRFDISEPDI